MEKVRVVIADDNAQLREMISEYLSKQNGLEVAGTAANGVEALKLVQEQEPDPGPDPEPEPEPEKSGGAGMLLAALAVLALGGGVGWYLKIYRPKQQKAAEPEEDFADYDEPEDYDDDPPWDVDDEDAGGDE